MPAIVFGRCCDWESEVIMEGARTVDIIEGAMDLELLG